MGTSDTRFVATNVPLKTLSTFAYDTKEDMVAGLSGTVSSLNFDVEAKVLPPDGAAPAKLTDRQLQVALFARSVDRASPNCLA